MTKRTLDLIVTLLGLTLFLAPMLVIMLFVKATSAGPVFYWSKRCGRKGFFFMMPKYRTMKVGTPELPTDKLLDADSHLTVIGSFLRRTSLDELPQMLSVLCGHMSVVGPRPALHNEHELISMRREIGIDSLRPGITGWAQINGRDDISADRKLALDKEYYENQSVWFDLKIIILTLVVVLRVSGVRH